MQELSPTVTGVVGTLMEGCLAAWIDTAGRVLDVIDYIPSKGAFHLSSFSRRLLQGWAGVGDQQPPNIKMV